MYAIVETGGKQYRVRPGDTIAVERLSGEPGDTLDLERVLLVGGDGDETRLGTPALEGAVVRAEVIEHGRGQKIIVFRYKSKVRYRRKTGHRQYPNDPHRHQSACRMDDAGGQERPYHQGNEQQAEAQMLLQ